MGLIASFKSSLMQHNVHEVNDAPTLSEIDDKAAYASGRGGLVIELFVLSSSHFIYFTVFFSLFKCIVYMLVA